MDRQEKLLKTARLGETVIFTENETTWCAAMIIEQHTPTLVTLEVTFRDGTKKVEKDVEYSLMLDKPRTWGARVKT